MRVHVIHSSGARYLRLEELDQRMLFTPLEALCAFVQEGNTSVKATLKHLLQVPMTTIVSQSDNLVQLLF